MEQGGLRAKTLHGVKVKSLNVLSKDGQYCKRAKTKTSITRIKMGTFGDALHEKHD